MRDLAVDEEVEIDMGASPDVSVRVVRDRVAAILRASTSRSATRARREIQFELRLQAARGRPHRPRRPPDGDQERPADLPLTIPAHAGATVRYQTQRAAG